MFKSISVCIINLTAVYPSIMTNSPVQENSGLVGYSNSELEERDAQIVITSLNRAMLLLKKKQCFVVKLILWRQGKYLDSLLCIHLIFFFIVKWCQY